MTREERIEKLAEWLYLSAVDPLDPKRKLTDLSIDCHQSWIREAQKLTLFLSTLGMVELEENQAWPTTEPSQSQGVEQRLYHTHDVLRARWFPQGEVGEMSEPKYSDTCPVEANREAERVQYRKEVLKQVVEMFDEARVTANTVSHDAYPLAVEWMNVLDQLRQEAWK